MYYHHKPNSFVSIGKENSYLQQNCLTLGYFYFWFLFVQHQFTLESVTLQKFSLIFSCKYKYSRMKIKLS